MARKKFKTLQELFKDETRWCKNHYAETAEGEGLDSEQHEDAASYCILGGVGKVYGDKYNTRIRNKIRRAISKLYPKFTLWNYDIACFNDHKSTTIKEIRKVVKLADV